MSKIIINKKAPSTKAPEALLLYNTKAPIKFSKYLIIGHDLSDDVDQATYGHRTLKQLREEINKLVIYK